MGFFHSFPETSPNHDENQDHVGNDIKRWNSVVSDMDDIQATDQLKTEQPTDNGSHIDTFFIFQYYKFGRFGFMFLFFRLTPETSPTCDENQDQDGNDIKGWNSVVSDMDDIQATDQLTVEQKTDTGTHRDPQ